MIIVDKILLGRVEGGRVEDGSTGIKTPNFMSQLSNNFIKQTILISRGSERHTRSYDYNWNTSCQGRIKYTAMLGYVSSL